MIEIEHESSEDGGHGDMIESAERTIPTRRKTLFGSNTQLDKKEVIFMIDGYFVHD